MKYIEDIENKEGILSKMDLPNFGGDLYKFLNDKKMENVHSERTYIQKNNVTIKNIIYKTPQNFYILGKQIDKLVWECSIYFKENSYNELIFFLNTFLKNYKNATTNN